MADYAPIRVTPETGKRLRDLSFALSARLGRRVTYGETVDIALTALANVNSIMLATDDVVLQETTAYDPWKKLNRLPGDPGAEYSGDSCTPPTNEEENSNG